MSFALVDRPGTFGTMDVSYNDRRNRLNKVARDWTEITKDELLFRLASLGVGDTVNLYARNKFPGYVPLALSLKHRIKRDQRGVLDRINISFRSSGLNIEHGVGRGRLSGSAAANQARKQWLGPVLDVAVELLYDQLADEYADIIGDDMTITVPELVYSKKS